MTLGLHNIHYRAQSDLANREVGESGTRRRTSLVAQSPAPVNPFRSSPTLVSPVLFPLPEALCVDPPSRPARGAVSCWLRLQPHSYLLKFEPGRLCLLCTSCGRETPGWELNGAPPRLRFAGAPRRHIAWSTRSPVIDRRA